jgi:hypothetical protein
MRYSDVVTASVPKFIFTEKELDIAIGTPNRERFEKGGWLRELKRMGKQRCFHTDDIEALPQSLAGRGHSLVRIRALDMLCCFD